MKGSMWAGIAAAANAVGGVLQSREADARKEKLYLMEQDIMQKRQEALASLRGDITDKNSANRADRTLNRIEFQHALTAGDITGGYEDKETGTYYGRTKDHQMIPLHVTSDEFQAGLKAIQSGKVAEANLAPEKTQAQINQTNASTDNLQSLTNDRDTKPPADKVGQPIRAEYLSRMRQLQTDDAEKAKAAKKAGEPYTPADPLQLQQQTLEDLRYTYGPDAVNAAIGKAPIPGQKPQRAPQGTDPRAPGVPQAAVDQAADPSHNPVDNNPALAADKGLDKQNTPGKIPVKQILMEYNAKSQEIGNNPTLRAQLDAKFQQLMTDNGYADMIQGQQQQ